MVSLFLCKIPCKKHKFLKLILKWPDKCLYCLKEFNRMEIAEQSRLQLEEYLENYSVTELTVINILS